MGVTFAPYQFTPAQQQAMDNLDHDVMQALQSIAANHGVLVVAHYTVHVPGLQQPQGHFIGDTRTSVCVPPEQHPSLTAIQMGLLHRTFQERISGLLQKVYSHWIRLWASREHAWAKDVMREAARDKVAEDAIAEAEKVTEFKN